MRHAMAALFVSLALAGAVSGASQAQQESRARGQAMAAEIQKNINELAPFAQTSCQAGGGNTEGSVSFLTISLAPIWENADAKQAWLKAVVEAVGPILASNPTTQVDEIIVADIGQLNARVAWALPAQLVKEIHEGVKARRISQDDVYPMIEKGLIRKPINAR